jgi:DNA-binding transcriptional ArsR family regulator
MRNPLQLLAEPNRVEILRLVWTQERSAGDIAEHFPITFGAVSQHLGALWREGFLRRRREGKRIFYAADREAMGPVAQVLEAMWRDRLGVLKTLAEAEQRKANTRGSRARRRVPRPGRGHES